MIGSGPNLTYGSLGEVPKRCTDRAADGAKQLGAAAGVGGANGNPQSSDTRRVARSSKEAPHQRKRVHSPSRSAQQGAPRSPVGACREGLHLRRPEGSADMK